MSAVLTPSTSSSWRLPPAVPDVPVWRLTVDEYHQYIAMGTLTEDDQIELLEGLLVPKMPKGKTHDGSIGILDEYLRTLLPSGWRLRIQCAVTLSDSEPEPDFAVVRGEVRQFLKGHPTPKDIGSIMEIADSSVSRDRLLKGRIYARAKIPVYWVVNLVDQQIEVYTEPGQNAKGQPAYLKKKVYRPGDQVPVVLFGQEVGKLAVGELLPG